MSTTLNKYITPPIDCTGCGLCANACPKDAITMRWNEDGFLVPQVNLHLCINCGVCVKKCIVLAELPHATDDKNSVVSYGAWNKNKSVLLNSSSGGIFSALAELIISRGGCVFGVIWEDSTTAIFAKTETVNGVDSMRGSKYTQAIPGYVYREVKVELKKNRPVLFSGTPCQVHALKSYLGKSSENLITIDILCHGVPSHLLLNKYIQKDEITASNRIKYISFRDKSEGWDRYKVTRHYSDGAQSSAFHGDDSYMKLFLCNKALNRVCYNCPFSHIPRQGDVTLGDYWGVGKHHPEWPLVEGISAVLSNTKKGQTLLEPLKGKIILIDEPFEKLYEAQRVSYIRTQTQIPRDRAQIISILRNGTLQEALSEALGYKRIGPFKIRKNHIIVKLFRRFKNILSHIKN